jgi:FkbM family methyltransferase
MKSIKETKKIISETITKYGVFNGLNLLRKLYYLPFQNTTKPLVLHLNDLEYPINIRRKTSDVSVAYDIFFTEMYAFPFLNVIPKNIIDAGANVGFASIFFANRYKNARIYAIEPETRNFEKLNENVSSYENIIPLNAALWYKSGMLEIANPSAAAWAFQVKESKDSNGDRVKALTISELMAMYKIDVIDILKVDIEGAEKQVFEFDSQNWLNKVRVIIGETHDGLVPGCSDALLNATKQFGFEMLRNKGNLIFYNPAYVKFTPLK